MAMDDKKLKTFLNQWNNGNESRRRGLLNSWIKNKNLEVINYIINNAQEGTKKLFTDDKLFVEQIKKLREGQETELIAEEPVVEEPEVEEQPKPTKTKPIKYSGKELANVFNANYTKEKEEGHDKTPLEEQMDLILNDQSFVLGFDYNKFEDYVDSIKVNAKTLLQNMFKEGKTANEVATAINKLLNGARDFSSKIITKRQELINTQKETLTREEQQYEELSNINDTVDNFFFGANALGTTQSSLDENYRSIKERERKLLANYKKLTGRNVSGNLSGDVISVGFAPESGDDNEMGNN